MLVDPYAAVWSADTSGMNGAADIALGFVNCGEETGDVNAGGGDFEGEQLDQGRVDTTLAVEREPPKWRRQDPLWEVVYGLTMFSFCVL